MYKILLGFLIVLLAVPVFAQDDMQDDMMLPEVIEIEQPGIIPEGIGWPATCLLMK